MSKVYSIALMLITILMLSCKEESHKVEVKEQISPMLVTKTSYIRYEPAKKSVIKEGEVIFEDDTMEVFKEYTDNAAFKQPIIFNDTLEGFAYYREMLVHLVNKRSNDTITLRKETFKKYMDTEYYEYYIMQSGNLNLPTDKDTIPLMINVCMPESDSCYFFDVRLDEKGNFIILDITDDFDMP